MACYCELQPLPPVYQKIFVENMTIVRPPILKIYYWESFDITGLNQKLKSNKQELTHTFVMPSRQIHSQPLKIILWLRNLSTDKALEIAVKRIKNCECQKEQTRVGFNQFRQLYKCPHRRLISVSQEQLSMQPDELLALSLTTFFNLYGEHILTHEFVFSDKRTLRLNFLLTISPFDPEKALLTKELLPVNIRKFDRVSQPIWVRNTTMMHLSFIFSSKERSLKLLNPNLTVPRQSVWPLMVEYRPNDYENEIELQMNYENQRARHLINARGVLEEEPEQSDMPLRDKECADYLYAIYPNRLSIDICLEENRTQIVNVHNFGQKCMEFRWQNYIINEFFSVSFEPQKFRLKGHHSKICVVNVNVFERILHFRRIPLVLEVHRVLDRATQIAKAELEEIESIDDPKWKQDSYVEHVFLQLNIKADKSIFYEEEDQDECELLDENVDDIGAGGDNAENAGSKDQISIITPTLPIKTPEEIKAETLKRLSTKVRLTANDIIEMSMAIDQRVTIFEKLFWKYLSKSNFMRISEDRTKRLKHKTYAEVIDPNVKTDEFEECNIDRSTILSILSRLMVEAITELSKNWIFIPAQYYERELH